VKSAVPLSLFIASLIDAAAVAAEPEQPTVMLADFSDGIAGYRYVWRIPQAWLAKLPKWSPTEAEPPLSPHQAVTTALAHLQKSFLATTKLTLYDLSISKRGIGPDSDPNELTALWSYHVSFTATPEPKPPERELLNVRVLMDGTIVTPKVTPLK
jgi:hypothetical protein